MKDYVPLIQTGLWVALIVLGVLIFRKPLLERIEAGVAIKAGPFEFGALSEKVENVQKEVSDLSAKVARVFLFAMPASMFSNLLKLSGGDFGPYEMSLGLERELYHLRDMGYIDVNSIHAIPHQGDDLSRHVQVTETGREFVEMRNSVTAGA